MELIIVNKADMNVERFDKIEKAVFNYFDDPEEPFVLWFKDKKGKGHRKTISKQMKCAVYQDE